MKITLTYFFAVSLLFFSGSLALANGKLRFANGDELAGELLGFSENNLTWESWLSEQPMELIIDSLLSFENEAYLEPQIPTEVKSIAVVQLFGSEDFFRGDLVRVEEDYLLLKTIFSDEMKLEKKHVSSLQIEGFPKVLYSGQNDLEEWSGDKGEDAWQSDTRSFFTEGRGMIRREIHGSDEVVISFQIAWEGTLRMELGFFSNNEKKKDRVAGYAMNIRNSYVTLKPLDGNNFFQPQGSVSFSVRKTNQALLEIKTSKRSGKTHLFIDHKHVRSWRDPKRDVSKMGNFFYINNKAESRLKVSQLTFRKWDGYEGDISEGEQNAEADPSDAKKEVVEGEIRLRNGDALRGKIELFLQQNVKVVGPLGEMIFPISRLREINVDDREKEQAKRYSQDVQIYSDSGGRLTFRLDDIRDGTLFGYNQSCGEIEVPITAVQQMKFNLYDKELNSIRASVR